MNVINLFLEVIIERNIEIYLFLTTLLSLLIINSKHTIKSNKSINVLTRIMVLIMIIIISDGLCVLINGHVFPGSIILNYIVNISSLSCLEIMSVLWLIYCIYDIGYVNILSFKKKCLMFIPILVMFIVLLSSPYTKLILYINDSNVYMRGPLFLVHSTVPFIYIAIAITLVAFKKHREILPEKRKNCTRVIIYGLIPFLGGILQLFAKNSNLLSLSLVMSANMFYINSINQEASLDPLTKLNNKLQFNSYLVAKTNKYKSNHLYLLYFDMNNFKSVNDNFGHQEGDKAIIQVANILKSIFTDSDSFCARNGGDEFAAVVETTKDNLLTRIDVVHEALKNASKNLPYTLSVSVGYAQYGTPNTMTIDALIKVADESMYENKARMKALGNLTEQPEEINTIAEYAF